jgi:hypothetical protein
MIPALTGAMRIRIAITGLFLAAQVGAQAYPNVQKRVEVAPGDTVMLLNRLINDGGPALRPPGRRLDFQISTSIPVSDSAARVQQADRAAQYFGPAAVEAGVRRLSIGICDTQACAERKHPPGAWYLYERTSNGWRRSP